MIIVIGAVSIAVYLALVLILVVMSIDRFYKTVNEKPLWAIT